MAQTLGTALDPRLIEEEISRVRERESDPYVAGTRTSLFNLVIFRSGGAGGGAAGTRDPVTTALDSLLGKRPARIISMEEGGGERTSVFVSGRCFPDVRNRGVCFEEIRIQNGADGLGRDLGTWSPLLIRDLPVFVWWLDRLSPLPPLLLQAAELIDKLLVDTAYCLSLGESPLTGLGELARLRARTRGIVTVSDLAWRRILPLRLHVARLFNPEEARSRLDKISRVSLSGGSRAEALLFFLWLAARLGWKARRMGGPSASFLDPSGGRIEAVQQKEAALDAGFGVGFSFSDAGRDLKLSCGAGGCVEMGDEKGVYRFLEDGELLLQEVDGFKQDPLLIEAIEAASEIPAAGPA